MWETENTPAQGEAKDLVNPLIWFPTYQLVCEASSAFESAVLKQKIYVLPILWKDTNFKCVLEPEPGILIDSADKDPAQLIFGLPATMGSNIWEPIILKLKRSYKLLTDTNIYKGIIHQPFNHSQTQMLLDEE